MPVARSARGGICVDRIGVSGSRLRRDQTRDERSVEGGVFVVRVRRERPIIGGDRLGVALGARQRIAAIIGVRNGGPECGGGFAPASGKIEGGAFFPRIVEKRRRGAG